MKIPFLLSLLLLLAATARGQTFEEWFRQKRTKEKYLVQQIAALQAYSGTLWQGYALARQGLSTVRHIQNGDLGLHQVFFRSLDQVNPVIRDAPLVQTILTTQDAISRVLEKNQALFRQPQYTPAEQAYLQQVQAAVREACTRNLDKLWLLLADNTLQLSDAARLRHLEVLRQDARQTYLFAQAFLKEAQLLALLRTQQSQDLNHIRIIHNLP